MKLLATVLFTVSLAAPAFFASAQAAQPLVAQVSAGTGPAQPDLPKGEASFAICAACHAPDGNSVIALQPKLAQQHPQYLIKQLQEFKTGKRDNPVMTGMANTLSNADMQNIAYWVAGKPVTPVVVTEKALLPLGERIYRGGIADRQIPACAGCHSPNGAGIPAQYPRLSGQHTEYVVAQLLGFRDGLRNNSLAMTQVAAKLNDREIKAVAQYIAGLR